MFLVMKITNHFRNKYLKKRAGITKALTNKIRYFFTYNSQIENKENEAKKILYDEMRCRFLFIAKLRKMMDFIVFMQCKIHNRWIQRVAKLEILDNGWNLLLFKMQNEHIEVKDNWTRDTIKQILCIPPVIKLRCLEEFLRACMKLHSIAFFQYRHMFKICKESEEVLPELITFVEEHLYERLNYPQINQTKKKLSVTDKYLKKYKNALIPAGPHNIYRFEQIGLFDPFS